MQNLQRVFTRPKSTPISHRPFPIISQSLSSKSDSGDGAWDKDWDAVSGDSPTLDLGVDSVSFRSTGPTNDHFEGDAVGRQVARVPAASLPAAGDGVDLSRELERENRSNAYLDAGLEQMRETGARRTYLKDSEKARLHKENPKEYNVERLARDYRIMRQRPHTILWLKELEEEEEKEKKLSCRLDDSIKLLLDPCSEDDEVLLAVSPESSCQINTKDWILKRKDGYKDNGDSQFVFNALDAMLKDNLDRLKKIRESMVSVNQYFGVRASASSVESCSKPYLTGHAALIRVLCMEGKIGAAIQLQKKMLQYSVFLDVYTYNYIMNGLCKMGDLPNAIRLLGEMMDLGVSPSRVTYNTLIDGYCRSGNVAQALVVYFSMVKRRIMPNKVTCNILVQVFINMGNLEAAKKLVAEIREHDESSLITSTILMDGCCKNGDIDQAIMVWESMSRKSIEVDRTAYNALINGCCLVHNMKFAYRYFCEMSKRGFLPDLVTYNTLISGLCKEGKFDEACKVHSDMSNSGVLPDQISYKMVIQGLCLYGNISKAIGLLCKMLEDSLIPKPLVWNVLIDSCGRHGFFEHAKGFQDQMVALGVVPNVFTYNGLIHAHAKFGNINDVLALKQKMLSNGINPDVVTYNLLIGCMCNSGHINFALKLHDEMLSGGYQPDIITYTELIRGLCMKGKIQKARELFGKVQKSGLLIDHVPFQILIKKYCRRKEPINAFNLYKEMLAKELLAHPFTYYALASELRNKGFNDEAVQVCNYMQKLVANQ